MIKFLPILLLLVLPLTSTGQNNATIEETIDFLKGRLEKSEKNYTKTIEFDKKKCELIIKVKQTGSTPFESIEYIPLNKIDPNSIVIIESKDLNSVIVHFDMIGKQELIRRTVIEKWEGGQIRNVTDNYIQWHFDLISKQNNIPERVKKALLHAIKLCGGKEEKF
jgi:hypothetical protein